MTITVIDNPIVTDINNAQYQWHRDALYIHEIWDETTGDENQKVAIADTGGTPTHPEFKDSNGVSRILPGVNTLHNWYLETDAIDTQGHGTHVSGVLGATGNNGIGSAGINWKCKMKHFRISENQHGDSTPAAVVDAFIKAADEGFPLINFSFGLRELGTRDQPSSYYQPAVDYAFERNCVIIAAAHNDSTNTGVNNEQARDIKRWLIVGAVTRDNQKTDYSNYGPWVDVVAPVGGNSFGYHYRTINHGAKIYVPSKNGTYDFDPTAFGGTSAATPEVAGLLSLALAIAPNLTNYQKLSLMRAATVKLNARWHDEFASAFGLVNSRKVKELAKLALPGASPRPTVVMATPKHNSTVYVGVQNAVRFEALVFDENPVDSVSLYINGSETPYATLTQLPYEFNWTADTVGANTFQLKAVSASGVGASEIVTVHALAPDSNVAPYVGFVTHRGGETVQGRFWVEAVSSCYSVPATLTPGPSVDPSEYPLPWTDSMTLKVYKDGVEVAALPQSVVGGIYGYMQLPNGVTGPITVEATAVTSNGLTTTSTLSLVADAPPAPPAPPKLKRGGAAKLRPGGAAKLRRG